MHHHSIGTSVVRRYVEELPGNSKLPDWAFGVLFLNLIVFLPVFLILGYTLGHVVPTLAIVEDPNPPAYEPLNNNENSDENASPASENPEASGRPVTTSLRATRRLLISVAGRRALFRGFWCAVFLGFAGSALGAIFNMRIIPLIPIGQLLAQLALVQFGAAWTHIVISAPNPLPFYRRLPPFRKAFEATCFPILAVWLATALTVVVSGLTAVALGIKIGFSDHDRANNPTVDGHLVWKLIVVALVSFAVELVTVVPANVILVRVQASLLPPEEDAIVPFDRSFQGKVEPAIVGGKGFVSMRDALATFPRASWIRLYKLYAKIFAATTVAYGLMAAVIVPQILLMAAKGN
ncbi:hypothetical protein B0H67DRAFT_489207 [Lasiosphaeris hirsuta]|uniref:Ubiquitin carrier protein n=1 Tax=Lasiosphaeris hirsuta TaxID=260670 RepID=A0AA40DTK9_9PEZI|nr:hypothetical protein B0H67DRAFT_489207 [Lasiosphaeris hirsuta]